MTGRATLGTRTPDLRFTKACESEGGSDGSEPVDPAGGITDETTLLVCSECLKASCWHWEFPCDKAQSASLVRKSVGELRKLNLEHESYWDIDPSTGVARRCGR